MDFTWPNILTGLVRGEDLDSSTTEWAMGEILAVRELLAAGQLQDGLAGPKAPHCDAGEVHTGSQLRSVQSDPDLPTRRNGARIPKKARATCRILFPKRRDSG